MKIYWSRGLYFNRTLIKLNWSLSEMFNNLNGFSNYNKIIYTKRFELNFYLRKKYILLPWKTSNHFKTINSYFSYTTNTASNIFDLLRYNLIRLYLIKTFRGRSQALGKPCRGQRTWSNAWTSHKNNTIIRSFINQVNKNRKAKWRPKKIDYKKISRKLAKPKLRYKPKRIKKQLNLWF